MKKYFISLVFSIPFYGFAQGALENPANNSTESGIGIISGWHCTATKVEAFIDGRTVGFAFVGSSRGDTSSICGKTNTGYSLLFNFNDLLRGAHNLKIYADGIKFGEANFNTTQSGGTAFLSNASKQVTVSDFPTPGANATLTWSQSKQSFVVTSIVTGSTTSTPTGIQKLFGSVTLNYKFNGSNIIYTDRTSFNNTNLSSDGILVKSLSNRDAVIACGLSKSSPEFLCLIKTVSSGSSDVFLIDINNTGSISGKYEYCLAGTSSSSCATDALLTPDGTVTGSVIRSSSTAIFEVNTQSRAAIGLDENHQFEKKLIEKLDNLDDETENPITESPTPEALQKIENAIEFIRTFIR